MGTRQNVYGSGEVIKADPLHDKANIRIQVAVHGSPLSGLASLGHSADGRRARVTENFLPLGVDSGHSCGSP